MAKYYKPKSGAYQDNVYILADASCNRLKCDDGTPFLLDVCTGEIWSTTSTFGTSFGASSAREAFEEVQKVGMTFKKACVVEFKI